MLGLSWIQGKYTVSQWCCVLLIYKPGIANQGVSAGSVSRHSRLIAAP